MIYTSDVIKDYLKEIRVRNPIKKSELVRRLVNLYKRTYGQKPSDNFETQITLSGRFEIVTSHDKPLPGVKIKGSRIDTNEFEKSYLRDTGWAIQSAFYNPKKVGSEIMLILDPKSESLPLKFRYLYHAAPSQYEESILSKGLIPKTRPYDSIFRYSEPRIYFTSRLNYESLYALTADKGRVENLSVFRIDTFEFDRFNIFSDDEPLSFGYDSVYTLTHIPPTAIKLIARMNNGKVVEYF